MAEASGGLFRHDVIPVVSGYVVVMSMFVAHRRDRRRRAARGRPDEPITIRGWPPTWSGLTRYLLATALGGYVVFIAVILLYYFALGGENFTFIRDALTGGVWLGFGIAVPGLLFLAWVGERTRDRRVRPPEGGSPNL
ncbi:MAG TPA: DUF6256 family protein [Actinomycetota bacterium]